MEAVAQFEEADAIIDRRIAELEGREGSSRDHDSQAMVDDLMSNIPIFLRGGNDDPMAVYPDEEPPSDTATDRREDLGASNNVNVNLDEGAEGQETRSRSQTSVPIIPIAAPIMNNEPTRNTMGNELSKMETGYHSSSSTSTPANVCNRFRDIQLSPSPEAMKISYGQPASSQCYAPVRPPRARDFHNQQEPIVEHSSEQVENSQLQPDDFELDSYEKIFSGPLQTPKNQTVGPSSSHHGCDFQHQSWSRTTEAIPSSTDSVYQSSPSTFPPSNAPFPDVMRIEYGGPTSSQCMLYAPAHYSSAYDSDVFDGQQPKQYCDLDKSASASLHQATTRNYFPRQGIIEPWSSDYSHNYQHKPLPGIVEVIPSRTDSGYQSSPSTFSLSNVSFPNVVRIEFGMSTSCQHPLYAPARSSRQYSEIVDSQQPKQYCGLNETVSDSWCQLTEPSSSSSSTYDHFQHQSLPDTIEANPTHFAKRKRAAPKNQNPRPAKKSRLAEKQLSHSLLASVQNPMTQDFDRESCSSNTTTFESNYSSSSHNNSPTLLQSVTQNRRELMDRDCDYTKKRTSKVRKEIIGKIDDFFERLGKIETIRSNERLAEFSLELDNLLKGRVDNSDREVYEAQKRQFYSTDDDWEQTVEKILELKRKFEKSKTEFEEKSQLYSEKETGTAGGAKSRARADMIRAQLDYDIACLDLIISKSLATF